MNQTENLDLPYIAAAQAQKHITHNEALRALDALVQIVLESRNFATAPVSPNKGSCYFVGSNATGEWQGQDNKIAAFQDNGWIFYPPQKGWLAWIIDENKLCVFDDINWTEVAGGGGASVNPADLVGVNTTADNTNKLAVKSDAVLLSHDDVTPGSGDIQAKFNKATAAHTASLLYQTDWSGRAEIGLLGSDFLSFKVSSDGTHWRNAFIINNTDGRVGISKTNPYRKLHIFDKGVNNAARVYIEATPGNSGPGIEFAFDGSGVIRGLIRLNAVGVDGTEFAFYTKQSGSGLSEKMRLHDSGGLVVGSKITSDPGAGTIVADKIGVGIANPTAKLHVNGVIRCKSYTIAALPNATTVGAGAQIFVSDETGGSVMAFSDGTNWRRCTDRAILS